ncbi:MAG: glycosyltransferase family 2 protein [Coriobacteriales bacterium]|nr:glycosyltransferase family 2 protein [Coriobacteriales bacterium]
MTANHASVAVVIPAHNEAAAIGETVRAALAIEGATRVLVVDDGSTDDTAAIAEQAGAEVLRLGGNLGKGAALDEGIARIADGDIVLLLDGDLGATAAEASKLIEPVAAGLADMSIAAFPRVQHKAGFGLVKRLARWGIRTLGGSDFEATAPLSGQRAIRASCLPCVLPFAHGYGVEVALTVRALRAGCSLVEVPTQMAHAPTGRNVAGFVHRGRQYPPVAFPRLAHAFERERPDCRAT